MLEGIHLNLISHRSCDFGAYRFDVLMITTERAIIRPSE